ncbi:hypothetical protein KC345_g11305, partial [Hortaea werneckii]
EGAGPIDFSCFVQLAGNALQCGQEIQYIDPDPPPAGQNKQGEHPQTGAIEPALAGYPEQMQNGVHQGSVQLPEDQAEHHTSHNNRGQCRNK